MVSPQQHGEEVAARVRDLDAWEDAEDARLARVGEPARGREHTHGEYARNVADIASAALSRHAAGGNLRWWTGFSAHGDPRLGGVPTPVIYVHHIDPDVPAGKAERELRDALKLIRNEMVARGIVSRETVSNAIRPNPTRGGVEYTIPREIWPTPRDVKWVQPGRGSAAFFGKPVSARGNWVHDQAFDVADQSPPEGPSSRAPGVYYHGTEREFDEINYQGDNLPGTFFTPDVRTAAVYGGAVRMTPEGVENRIPAHFSEVSPSSRVISARIDTGGMPGLSEADRWLRERDAHPQDDPDIARAARMVTPDPDHSYLDRTVDPFWLKYQRLCDLREERGQSVPRPPRQDYCWGPIADHLRDQGAPGMQAPDSLLRKMDRSSPEGEEIVVYDPSRVEVLGETRPRYVMMDVDVHATMAPVRERAELAIADDCPEEVSSLYGATTDLDECLEDDADDADDCDDEQDQIVEARKAVEECADETGEEYRARAGAVGGDATFDELRGALRDYRMDPGATDTFRRDLLGQESWPPANYRDPSLARGRLSEALESGYVAPRSDLLDAPASNILDEIITRPKATGASADHPPPDPIEPLREDFSGYKGTSSGDGSSFWRRNTGIGANKQPARASTRARGMAGMRRWP